jgi:hypothetical protein
MRYRLGRVAWMSRVVFSVGNKLRNEVYFQGPERQGGDEPWGSLGTITRPRTTDRALLSANLHHENWHTRGFL